MSMQELPRMEDSVAMGNILVSEFEDPIKHEVKIYDETLRDGEQTIGVAFSPEQKLEIARGLLEAGVRDMTVGFPAVSESERETVRRIVSLKQSDGMGGLARPVSSDIDAVLASNISNVVMFLAISDCHLKHKLNMDIERAFDQVQEQIRMATERGLNVRFSFEDASRAPFARVKRFIAGAVEAGASQVAFPDTNGVMTPMATHRVVVELLDIIGDVPLIIHLHNDLGMATANSLVAAAAGARYIHGALCGLGERAGNTSLEEIAVGLQVKYGVDLGVDLGALTALAQRVAEMAKFQLGHNKPVLGRNVFAHESGIHVHGVSREATTYEPYPPEIVGRQHEFYYGKHSGISSIRYVARAHDIECGDDDIIATLAAVKAMAEAEGGRNPDQAEVADMLRARAAESPAS